MIDPTLPVVQFAGVSKTFGDVKAVNHISFDIRRGEFFSILGPSGCGKTTTLRLLAGFEEPDADGGEVRLLGEVGEHQAAIRAADRRWCSRATPCSLTSRSSGTWPSDWSSGRRPSRTSPTRVRKALEMVRLAPDKFIRRMPAQLSGGQRQRVALARALVLNPAILLLDEPLGAVDLKVRKEMQLELKALNQQLGMTFVYVTHDQEEALTMCDRIAVMDNGLVAQLGTPAEIYENPRTAFVAKFIGESNFFERPGGPPVGEPGRAGAGARRVHPGARQPGAPGRPARCGSRSGRNGWTCGGRPRCHRARMRSPATIRDVIYLGETMHVMVTAPGRQRGHRRPPQRGPAHQAAALEAG